ncbi:MAG TPA: zinc-dependent metalloprotease [Candidatus Bacteroides intestinigallinarum]|nr:zinc-dependent metalloprotease [Candidatus Bacteroides intestinigallinarum]
MRKLTTLLLLLVVLIPTAGAQSTDLFKKKKKKKGTTEAVDKAKADSIAKAKKDPLQPYGKVITGKAKTMNGFFKVHNVEGKYYFEIADSLLGRDILVVNRIVKAPVDKQKRKAGYPGDHISDEVIRFEIGPDNKLFVRQISYLEHSADTLGLYQAVLNSNVQPIVATFPLKTIRRENGTKNYVIEMTDFIRKDNEMFSFSSKMKDNIGATSMIAEASYIDTLKAFPQNIEVRTVRTFQRKSPMGSAIEKMMAAYYSSTGPMTYELNSSLLLLPKEPMKPRLFDSRVGYFAVGYKDFDENPHGVKYKANITRWRLEPKDEDKEKYLRGELVEPKNPIVIYIDPATPKKWVPYLIQGVNDWQAAFEKAGFKNAIIGKEAPTDDPTWSLEDARHSAIVYKPSDIPNASGPHVHDPRSGEILETHINWYHNVMSLLYNWYIVQAGAIDPGARKPQFDDELMGELIRFVSSHEVGHTLGLRHNFGSSATVPVEKLRDKAWVEANGHTPSIMDYARFNYVAQPEDSISRTGIFPRIGMYDKWAIEWGYRWLPEFETAEAEIPHMNKWIIKKLKEDKRYTFGTESDRDDPRNQNEDLGDDAMLASTYGIKNLKRVMPEIMNWTYEPNEGYEKASALYSNVVGQFYLYMGHVATNVGGIYSTPISVEQTDVKAIEYVPKDIQKKAMAFLNKELFTTPAWLMDNKLTEKTKINTFNQIFRIQSNILKQLVSSRTLDKMTANELMNGNKAYTANDMFLDLKKSIWSDLRGGKRPDLAQRGLQKTYVNALVVMLDKPKNSGTNSILFAYMSDSPSEAPAIARGQLTDLRRELTNAANASSGIYKSHYLNLKALIDAAFEVK